MEHQPPRYAGSRRHTFCSVPGAGVWAHRPGGVETLISDMARFMGRVAAATAHIPKPQCRVSLVGDAAKGNTEACHTSGLLHRPRVEHPRFARSRVDFVGAAGGLLWLHASLGFCLLPVSCWWAGRHLACASVHHVLLNDGSTHSPPPAMLSDCTLASADIPCTCGRTHCGPLLQHVLLSFFCPLVALHPYTAARVGVRVPLGRAVLCLPGHLRVQASHLPSQAWRAGVPGLAVPACPTIGSAALQTMRDECHGVEPTGEGQLPQRRRVRRTRSQESTTRANLGGH